MSFLNKVINSFRHAIYGVMHASSERSVRIHAVAGTTVLIFAYWLGLEVWEWCVIIFAMGTVLSAELFNTSIESLANVVRDQNTLDREATKLTRDIAAGAVLLSSISSAIVGLLIFLPKIFA